MQIMTIAPKLAALPGMTVDSVDPGTGGAFAAVLDAGAAVVAMPSITRSACASAASTSPKRSFWRS